MRTLSMLCLLTLLGSRGNLAAQSNSPFNAWLKAQTNVQTWSADLVQTKSLKAITTPQKEPGHVWFAQPNRFRWQLRNPPVTIAVRSGDELQVIYPKLKRVERLPMNQAGEWRDTLALLDAGFPHSQADLESRFRVQSETISNDVCEVALEPKSVSARRTMPLIKITFGTNDLSLRATELTFGDGSSVRNEFSNPVVNPKLDDQLFAPEIGADFKVVEPLKRKK